MAQPMKPQTRAEHAVWQDVRRVQDRVTDAITEFAGSLRFVWIHVGWFTVWLLLNLGVLGGGLVFDEFPFGLLTLIVSLEAIFLSTFVMITQNRQAARADVRSQLDFETNLRSEVWSVHIGQQLGLDPAEVEQHVQRMIADTQHGITAGTTPDTDPATSA